MSSIIRQCPFYRVATQVEVAGQRVEVRPYQIILWVSLRTGAAVSPPFPAILDIGHSLNFSIREEQLRDWAGIVPSALREIGRTTLNNRPVFLSRADVGLHRNLKRQRDELLAAPPVTLVLPEGIVIHPRDDLLSPRLPLVGLRALVHNQLKAIIDGRNLLVSIKRGIF
jgi:hypothetical protein